MKDDSEERKSVRYKLLAPESLDDVLRFQCTLCHEIRNTGDLVFHAAVIHGTPNFTADSWPQELNE